MLVSGRVRSLAFIWFHAYCICTLYLLTRLHEVLITLRARFWYASGTCADHHANQKRGLDSCIGCNLSPPDPTQKPDVNTIDHGTNGGHPLALGPSPTVPTSSTWSPAAREQTNLNAQVGWQREE